MAIILFAETPRMVIWDPLTSSRFCNKVVKSFQDAFGGGVKPNITRVQHDGWRCGYFSTFWYIYVDFLLKEDQSSFMELSWTNPEIPPEGWECFVHLLLQARDVTPDKYDGTLLNL